MPHRATSRKQGYAWWVLTPRSLGVTFAVIFFCRHSDFQVCSVYGPKPKFAVGSIWINKLSVH